MYLAVIILPLLGSIVSGFFGRKVGVSGAQLITSLSVILTTIIAVFAFTEVVLNNIPVFISLIRWIDSESLSVIWGFSFDSLTVSMLIPVLVISSLVHIYSIGYMSHDPHNQRFFSYLSLFTFMMIILITANNFLLMFVGWEGVGVCSYLLVSFWFTRIAANQSSMSAFLTNRVGDCFLTLGMFTILWTFGNLDYSTVFSLAPYINENAITIIGICLLIGAMAKSSQIGLHVWLPLAMEGPTPVSALIHAATMVTAGVYLLMRSSPLVEYSSTVLIICLWVGSVTTVFSSLIGLFQQDIKKVIAYSTMSQLGMMVIAVGLSSYNLALFHLINHAFYKGLLFLGAGAVIHAVADNQDFRKYGGLLAFLPLTYSVMLIASLSLVAFPFMTGFYSKDFILESAFGQFTYSSITVYFIAVVGAMFTTLYSVKVLYLTFITNPNGPLVSYKKAHESDVFMSLPLIILAVFSIFFGYISKDIFIGLGTGLFVDNSLFIHPKHEIMLNTEFAVLTLFKLLPLGFTLSLTIMYVYIVEVLPSFVVYFKSTRLGYNIFNFFSLRFLVEFIYNRFVARFILNLGGLTTKVLDKGSVEAIGPYGLEKGLRKLSENLSRLDTGVITSYALYILIGLILYTLTPYIFSNDISLFILMIFILFVINKSGYSYNLNQSYISRNLVLQSSLSELPYLSSLILFSPSFELDLTSFNITSFFNYLFYAFTVENTNFEDLSFAYYNLCCVHGLTGSISVGLGIIIISWERIICLMEREARLDLEMKGKQKETMDSKQKDDDRGGKKIIDLTYVEVTPTSKHYKDKKLKTRTALVDVNDPSGESIAPLWNNTEPVLIPADHPANFIGRDYIGSIHNNSRDAHTSKPTTDVYKTMTITECGRELVGKFVNNPKQSLQNEHNCELRTGNISPITVKNKNGTSRIFIPDRGITLPPKTTAELYQMASPKFSSNPATAYDSSK